MNKNPNNSNNIKTALLVAGLAVTIIFLYKASVSTVPKTVKEIPASPDMTAKKKKPEEPKIYDINKVKQGMVKTPEEEYADMRKDHEKYPGKYDINYMPSPVFKMKPEEKAQIIAELNKSVDDLKEALKLDPKDQKARSKLFLSETLKKIVLSTSEYSQEEIPPNEKL
ncbi:MAG: hypothetical protein WC419_04045 [Candidatus Omnitrophota bacterium]|jgi:hypothetical protein